MAEKKPAPKKRAPKKPAEPDVVEAAPVVEATPVVVEVQAVTVHTAPVVVTHDEIARRAYEIWRRNGGSALDNWLAAERELGA